MSRAGPNRVPRSAVTAWTAAAMLLLGPTALADEPGSVLRGLRRVSGDGGGTGRQLPDGRPARRRRCRRRPGADGEHPPPVRYRQARDHVRAVGCVRGGRRVPARRERHRLRPRRPPGDARHLGGCADVRGVALGDDGQAVPAPERGRVGVRGARGKPITLPLGQRRRRRQRQLRRLREPLGRRAHRTRRVAPGQRVRRARHDRQPL